MVFTEFHSGLYYHDTLAPAGHKNSASVTNYTLLNTVTNNKSLFMHCTVEGADKARELYQKIGWPSQKFFQEILSKRMIHNCPITPKDAKCALIIYGPNLAMLKGKTTRKNGEHIPSTATLHLPRHILEHHANVTLCMNAFFVQGQHFHHTISRDIKFRTISPITAASKPILQEITTAVINAYHHQGFTVTNIHADGAFECLREAVAPAVLNVNATDEHVGEVERSIRTIKE